MRVTADYLYRLVSDRVIVTTTTLRTAIKAARHPEDAAKFREVAEAPPHREQAVLWSANWAIYRLVLYQRTTLVRCAGCGLLIPEEHAPRCASCKGSERTTTEDTA